MVETAFGSTRAFMAAMFIAVHHGWWRAAAVIAGLETGFGAARLVETAFGAARTFMTAIFIAMHHGWWRAATFIAGAVIAVEVATRAVVIAAEVSAARGWAFAGRHGLAEVLRAAMRLLIELRTRTLMAARRVELLRRGHAAFLAVFHAALWLGAGTAVMLTVGHGRGALAVIGGAAEGAVVITAGGVLGLWAVVVVAGSVLMARGVLVTLVVIKGTGLTLLTGLTGLFTRSFAAGLLTRGFRGGSRWFGGFLGGQGGDAEGAEREQHETMAGFGFHGLEGGGGAVGERRFCGVQRHRDGELCAPGNIL